MSTVTFKNRSFEATIDLDALPEHPIPLTRKLFKQMFSDPWGNDETILATERWFNARIRDAVVILADRTMKYEGLYREVSSRSRRPEANAQRSTNRALTCSLNTAKSNLADLERLQTIFNEFTLNGETTNV